MNRTLTELLKEKILVLDGAMGTAIHKHPLTADDFGGTAHEGCNEHLVLTRPDIISSIHEGYLKAGADIIETGTFGATRIVLSEFDLQDKTHQINKAAAELAGGLCRRYGTSAKPRFVAGSMGPGTKSLSVTGGIRFEDIVAAYQEQAEGLMEGGVHALYLETAQDTLNLKAGLLGIDKTFAKLGRKVPVMVSATIEPMGTMLAGQDVESLYISLEHKDLLSIGINCATGPEFMTDHIRTLSAVSRFAISCMPNAGLPDEEGRYNETPEMIVKKLERFVENGWLNIVGGCCGTHFEHIRLMAEMVEGKKPRVPPHVRRHTVSGIESLLLEDDKRPVLVGERTNVIGSRLFKKMIVEEKLDEASEVARRQARNGAQIIDVCLANPDRDEKSDMDRFLSVLTKKVKLPLMIDTTDPDVLETALRKCMGKCIINSINLEDGEERFRRVIPLQKDFGAMVVVGCIDEDKQHGMAVDRKRKIAIAARSYDLLTQKYGVVPEDILFDLLVFPIGTGDPNYIGSPRETIEAIRQVKQTWPRVKTVLGISNISFGLPEAGREVINAVYLHHCVSAGLDLAIVNSEKLARYISLSDEDKTLSEGLLFSTPDTYQKSLEAFTNHFRTKVSAIKSDARAHLTPRERTSMNVVEGSKDGLAEDLAALLKTMSPLEIVNGPLMEGMAEVGRLFNANQMIVAEVLQSAEVMKAAVTLLEPHMTKDESAHRGVFLLATVKGDVHDIGKNLVHIILHNNGFKVIDLGIKVPTEDILKAAQEHKPDLIGLSGLLVKSTLQMATTAEDLKSAGIRAPLLVGGAALTEKFTALKIASVYEGPVVYCKDAMTGLAAANHLLDDEKRPSFMEKLRGTQLKIGENKSAEGARKTSSSAEKETLTPVDQAPLPPDLKTHILKDFAIDEIFRYINPTMLYGKHLGLRGQISKLLDANDPQAVKLHTQVKGLQEEIVQKGLIRPAALWKFFPAQSDGDTIHIYETPSEKKRVASFTFPRQPDGERLCLSDFVLSTGSGQMDYLAFFVVTCGGGISSLAAQDRQTGDYLRSHVLQAVALESAEAFAELLHGKIRSMWGFADPDGMTLQDKFQSKYRGSRFSFGYPACPDLSDQKKLFALLKPEESIGVRLTENDMMDPEASVSAIVFHHPQARYFSVT
ncbi:MAG TPA: methionine synthase [Elusimicrobiota bacterium]|nr:methionine synthase [Elusimicrobiota bacterium]